MQGFWHWRLENWALGGKQPFRALMVLSLLWGSTGYPGSRRSWVTHHLLTKYLLINIMTLRPGTVALPSINMPTVMSG